MAEGMNLLAPSSGLGDSPSSRNSSILGALTRSKLIAFGGEVCIILLRAFHLHGLALVKLRETDCTVASVARSQGPGLLVQLPLYVTGP